MGNLKPVFVASILAFSIVGLGFFIQEVTAEHGEDPGITKPLVTGFNTLNFRDITNNETQTSSITVDSSQSKKGFLTINLEEIDSNLDATSIDMLNATANSTTSGAAKAIVKLTETDINSGLFSGRLFLSTTETVDDTLQVSEGDEITVNQEEPQGVARMQAELSLDSPGNVKITDNLINDVSSFKVNEGVDWRPVIHPVKIQLLGDEKIGAPIIYVDADSSTSFTAGEAIYDDVDKSETRNAGDTRIANAPVGFADGTTILGGDADDDGAALTSFPNPVKFVDTDNSYRAPCPCEGFTAGEAIYEDVDRSGNVNPGDIRIANAPVGFADGTTVLSGDSDDNVGRTSRILSFVEEPVITLSYANAVFEAGDNPAELNMYYRRGPLIIDGVEIAPASGWTNTNPIRDFSTADPSSHDPVQKTITSDPTNSGFGADGNHIFYRQGVFAVSEIEVTLGFKSGIGGGGGGGLVRPGFVVNALAGANVISSFFGKGGASGEFTGGSSNGPAKPIVTSGTVNDLSNENIGFVQQGEGMDSSSDSTSKSLGSTQNVVIGKDLTFKYNVYENKGHDRVVHATMYFFDAQMMDVNDRINTANSETYIMYEKGQPVKVVDPYGYFEKASFELLPIDTYNAALEYDITFSKIMPESHIVLRTWDTEKYSTDTLYENAIVVSENSNADDNPIKENDPLTQSEFEASPFLDTQFEPQLQQEETVTKTGFPGIPLWVKNNAMWWHEKQIDDEDFVAGIQYMINEEILTIPETQIKNSAPEEIPSWVSNIAGYWSNDQIPDDQFIQVMQWLVSNGVMEV